jgi:hypothetical protein
MSAGTHSCDFLIESRLDETGAVLYGTLAEVEEIVSEQVWPTFFETSVFKQLQQSYLWDESAQNRLIHLFDKQFGETSVVLCWKLEQVLNDMLVTRDPFLNLIPKAPVASEPPQLKRARELKNLRAEIEADLERNGLSTVQIKEKRAQNPEYDRLFKEMQSPQTAVNNLPEFSQELNDFAFAYNASTRASMNLVGGVRRVGGVPYGSDTFEKMLERASALGLIRG